MSGLNIHIYPSPITHESRMLKETKTIADAGLADEIYLVGIGKENLPERERLDDKRQIWRVRPKIGTQQSGLLTKSIRYAEWQARVFFAFRGRNVRLVNCHSLPALPIGVLFKLFAGARLVYDTHELETESDAAIGAKRLFYKMVEKSLIRYVDLVITVNESIARWYKKEYSLIHVYAVRNVPYQAKKGQDFRNSILKTAFGIEADELLFIFQGSLSQGRGIEMILNAFTKVDRRKHVVFMGFGPLEGLIREYEKVHSNIHFHPAVKPAQVSEYTSGADVGICLQEDMGLNHYLSLPNKFFEYITSGLPVIASDFPEMARVLDEAGCGWKVPVDRAALLALINCISGDDVMVRRTRAREYRETIGWENEEKILLRAYRTLDCPRTR
jgi:glycosyltransferase involved in cell wall biosynthesis